MSFKKKKRIFLNFVQNNLFKKEKGFIYIYLNIFCYFSLQSYTCFKREEKYYLKEIKIPKIDKKKN
jgi:hypothetical protein